MGLILAMIYFHLRLGWNEVIYLLALSLEFCMCNYLTHDVIISHFRRENQWCWSSCCSCSPTYLVTIYKPSVTMILYPTSVLTLSCSCLTGCNHFVVVRRFIFLTDHPLKNKKTDFPLFSAIFLQFTKTSFEVIYFPVKAAAWHLP